MEVGVEVWLKDTKGNLSWIPGAVHLKYYSKDDQLIIVIRTEFEEDFQFILKDENEDLENVKLRNDESESNVDNLISLPYLHEPAILFCLERRYSHGDIYTYTGPILIAMNPFKKVPLYSNQILEIYYNDGLLKSQGIESGTHLPPHVYAIADSAYRLMMQTIMSGHGSFTSSQLRSGAAAAQSANHSILISGESGAGKTESTKIVLRYLTTVGSSTGSIETESGSVMDKVLKSNPILEAFGNARTLRNDNSSRFGKFIQLNFNKRGHLIGGIIRTYLLEKVRLPSQQRGERNFHIFYQLFAGATEAELIRWDFKAIELYEYVLQGGIYKLQTIDDKFEYGQLKHALNVLNFSQEDQAHLLDLTAALLHLGQVKFLATTDGEGEGSVVSSDSQQYLAIFSKLCCLDINDIIRTLTVRSIVAREETYEKKLTAVQASDAKDAVAKAIYGKIFDWIVRTINLSIQVEAKLVRSSIGVLDIFGFECFVHNSFEQLCINYTNETLQQQFNQYIFKMEQIEYQKEKIEWSFIEFPDNQDCLDLIEHKVNGILAMIDDECRLPNSSDTKLASRMYKAYEQNHRFAVSTTQKRDHQFCINHYAGAVVYSSITFVEKNKDELPKEATSLLQGSKQSLLSILFSTLSHSNVVEIGMVSVEAQQAPVSRRDVDKTAPSNRRNTAVSNISMASVGSQFKEQLHTLMESIYATTPHYIRCLKPNDLNVPDNFERIRIAEQLRYGGVLEAVRVARSGFPVRLSHADFYARYRPLANPFSAVTKELPAFCHKEKVPFDKMKSYCEMLLSALWDESIQSNISPLKTDNMNKPSRRRSCVSDQSLWKNKVSIVKESVQLGLNKVFLRKPAHDVLESRRSRRILSAARRIQARFRCKKMRFWYLTLRMAVNLIQNIIRGMIAKRKLKSLKKLRATLLIQSNFRMFVKRSKFLALVKSVNTLKGKFRIGKSKEKVSAIRKIFHVLRLQRIFRGIVCRYRYRKYRLALVSLQCCLRRIRAKEELKQLRIAAKDLGKLQQSNEALKHEIEALKAKAFEERERIKQDMEKSLVEKANAAKDKEFVELRLELANAYKMLEAERQLHQQAVKKLTVVENEYKSCQSELYQVTEQFKRNNNAVGGIQGAGLSSRSSFRRSSLTATIASEENDYSSSSGNNNTTPTNNTTLVHPPMNTATRRRSREQQQLSQNVISTNDNVIREALEKEIHSREALEEEVSRLRQISMDYKAQIDHLRKNTTTDSNNPAALINKGRGSAITKNATTAKLQTTSTSASLAEVANTVVVQNSTDDSSLNNWSAAWDDNDDSSEVLSNDLKSIENDSLRSRTPLSATAATSSLKKVDKSIANPLRKSQHSNSTILDNNKVDITTALSTFEKNLDMFRTKLKQGVKAYMWEGQKISNAEVIIKLDDSNRLISFDTPIRYGFSFFQSRVDASPVGIPEIAECLPGAELDTESIDKSLMVTLVTKATSTGSRILAFKFMNADLRNTMLSGFRTMSADISKSSITKASNNAIIEDDNPMRRRSTRRLNVRENILEEKITQINNSNTTGKVDDMNSISSTDSVVIEELKNNFKNEKNKNERIAMQMIVMSNELHERDEQIALLKKKEEHYEKTLQDRDNMYKQDTMVRMQLGKRLEQVLMDKEDAIDQLEALQEQLASIKLSMS